MILVIGHGKMGKRHTAALIALGYEYHLLDIHDNPTDYDMSKYSHFIISSPNDTHTYYYHNLKMYNKPMLIEKPSVLKKEDLWILDDPLVSSGMSRRFHPIVRSLKENPEILERTSHIQIIRKGPKVHEISPTMDLGIHGIDLGIYLGVYTEVFAVYHEFRTDLMILWHEDRNPEIFNFVDNCFIRPDDLFVVDKDDSIEHELKFFLGGGRIDAKLAHEIVIEDKRT